MPDPNEFPIIKLTVQHMQHSILLAINNHMLNMGDEIKKAVEAACTPEQVKRVVEQSARETLDKVIALEVRRYFEYGEGRPVIEAAVVAKLKDIK